MVPGSGCFGGASTAGTVVGRVVYSDSFCDSRPFPVINNSLSLHVARCVWGRSLTEFCGTLLFHCLGVPPRPPLPFSSLSPPPGAMDSPPTIDATKPKTTFTVAKSPDQKTLDVLAALPDCLLNPRLNFIIHDVLGLVRDKLGFPLRGAVAGREPLNYLAHVHFAAPARGGGEGIAPVRKACAGGITLDAAGRLFVSINELDGHVVRIDEPFALLKSRHQDQNHQHQKAERGVALAVISASTRGSFANRFEVTPSSLVCTLIGAMSSFGISFSPVTNQLVVADTYNHRSVYVGEVKRCCCWWWW